MAPTAGSAVFLDTNILIYASFPSSIFHAVTRSRLIDLETSGAILWASRQVLREFLAVATRPGNVLPLLDATSVSDAVRQFEAVLRIADEDADVTALLLDLVTRVPVHGKQIHDANIVATMKRNGIRFLLTQNARDFTRYAPEIELLPLLAGQ